MQEETYFGYWITNIQGSHFSCFTQSGDKKEYDGTLSAKQGYVVITNESTTNGVHKYVIGNDGSFNGDNGDYSKWKALATYTLPSNAIHGDEFTYMVSGRANVPLTEYHGVKVYGTPQVIYSWSINKDIAIPLKLSYIFQNGLGFVFKLRHPVHYDSNNKMINITYSVKVDICGGKAIKRITISITTSNGIGETTYTYHEYNNCTAVIVQGTATFSPKSGTLQNGGKFIIQEPRSFT